MITKDQYLNLRTNRDAYILYEYYLEKFDESKHSPKLGPQEFLTFFTMWGSLPAAFDKVVSYFDQKFNVRALLDEKGELIKYV